VIGALILFRLAYFLVPLCIGSLLFVLLELLMRTGRRAAAAKEAASSDQPG
jgi:uncharacterized membrane protein YbhN (UPF0104 family)